MKKFMIFGDSYSTYEGCIPEGYATYYLKNKLPPEEPQDAIKNMELESTWWMRLIKATGAELVQNNSWSGSSVCYTGYSGDCSHSSSFIYRYRQLKEQGFFLQSELDTIIVFGGTNDSWSNSPIGELQLSDWKEEDLFAVLPAFAHFMRVLCDDLPKVRKLFVINTELKESITDGIEALAKHFGIETVKLSEVDKLFGHPTAHGMEQIFEQVLPHFI